MELPCMSSVVSKKGFDLSPGDSRTYLLDLSELQRPIPSGPWALTAHWQVGRIKVQSSSAEVEILESRDADREAVSALRRTKDSEEATWASFLIDNPRTIFTNELEGISSAAHREVMLYLFLHRAIWGPTPPASLPLQSFRVLARGPWESEAALLSYECLVARGSNDAALARQSLLSKWPGLKFRVDNIDDGEGPIAELREEYGRDSMKFEPNKGPYDD